MTEELFLGFRKDINLNSKGQTDKLKDLGKNSVQKKTASEKVYEGTCFMQNSRKKEGANVDRA